MTQPHSHFMEGYDAGYAAAKEALRAERVELRNALHLTIYYEFEHSDECSINVVEDSKECSCGADDAKKEIREVLKKYWEMK